MDKIKELLASITEETSVEEARRIILEVSEKLAEIETDVNEYQRLVNEGVDKIAELDAEIARLKEENGRIYRERAETIKRNVKDKIDDAAEDTDTLEKELIDNIDI